LKRFGQLSTARRSRIRKVRQVALQVAILCVIKTAVHFLGLERISVSQLFSALVASTVFLLGFLLSGVLTDFKESEKIPGEIATSLESLFLEISAIPIYNKDARVRPALSAVIQFGHNLLEWLIESINSDELLTSYHQTHSQIVLAAAQIKGDASTLRGRLMQDLAVVLQRINRVQQIRDTSFVPLVYWMAYTAAGLLFAGLILAKSTNLSESVFFLAVISFLVILLLRLIDDIDNPFGYSDPDSAEDISITILEAPMKRLRASLASHS
jgi:predicted membrane chloride channel (bestrophin family)